MATPAKGRQDARQHNKSHDGVSRRVGWRNQFESVLGLGGESAGKFRGQDLDLLDHRRSCEQLRCLGH
jgi:hypothetical protein